MTGSGNWTWLLPGRVTTLIDAGTGEPQHLQAVEDALAGKPLHQVIVSHGHTDHVSGAPALAARFPGARFLKMPWPDRDTRYAVAWEGVAAGEVIEAGDTALTVIYTPGHAPDHFCLWHEPSRSLFGADLATQGSSIYIPSTHGGDLITYLASLERVLAMAPSRIFPAHGPVIEDPPALLKLYIAHRQERERQVLAGLRAGLKTPDELAARIYPDVKEKLIPIARDTVVAHLLKLERDGRIKVVSGFSRTGEPEATEAWHIIEP
jgi:glyoxylase-like metal-dependent hydrolase (beta-lactamase superfamily II)